MPCWPTPRNDAGRRFFADETCNHHFAACSSLPGRCLRAHRTRPPPQQRPLGVTEACLFTKQLVQDRLLQWISLFCPRCPPPPYARHVSRASECFRDPDRLGIHMRYRRWDWRRCWRLGNSLCDDWHATDCVLRGQLSSKFSTTGLQQSRQRAVVTHGQRRGQRARPGLCWHNTRPPRPG